MGKEIGLWSVVVFHWVIIVANVTAFFTLPFLPPSALGWAGVWLCFPINTFIVRLAIVNQECPLTTLENKLRHACGHPQINTFLGHYVVKHYYRWKARKKVQQRREEETAYQSYLRLKERFEDYEEAPTTSSTC